MSEIICSQLLKMELGCKETNLLRKKQLIEGNEGITNVKESGTIPVS